MGNRSWPCVEIVCADGSDLALAIVDDFGPTAVEEGPQSIRIFFPAAAARDSARAALIAARYTATSVEVDDEDWARRSQEDLKPITVGRITVAPPWALPSAAPARDPAAASRAAPITLVIEPSMGFGTGHHATTRLCLAALQAIPIDNAAVIDVGTGSGVLAIAAVRLGAASAIGIDCDPDAIQSARENLALNPEARSLQFRIADLAAGLPDADVVIANLTGTLLVRSAEILLAALRPGGTLIVSGLLAAERQAVVERFATLDGIWEETEGEWVGLALTRGGVE